MKKYYKFIFVSLFVISSFIFMNNVQASYKAYASNPSGAKCELNSNSTGYCLYSDSSLSDIVHGPVWLDTGNEVVVLQDTKYPDIVSKDVNKCSDGYTYVSHVYNNKTYYGYYCKTYLKAASSVITDELKKEFKEAGFPESYFEKLAVLKTAHPNWNFKAVNTGLDFNTVVTNQSYGNRSLLRISMSNNYAYLSIDPSSFDYKNDKYIPYDSTTGSDPWCKANTSTIAYYLDPRNFLDDMYIFQFQTLSYDESIEDDKILNSINGIFGDDYLKNFANDFLEAGKQSKVNPIYLSSLSKEEVHNGSTPGTAIDGKYNGMYNFYNIGATSGANPVYRGLDFAAGIDESVLRPWNTPTRAIIGGAKWIYNDYIYTGQDTSYFKKYNVVYNYLVSKKRTPTYNNYEHQYMQNIKAPSSEAATTYKSYIKNNMLDLSYTFYIPIYNNMPTSTTLSTKTGWPNNYLKSMSINGQNIPGFNGEVENYNYNLDINNPKITISATAVNSSAKVEGTGTFEIKENTTKIIKVTAQNGDIKNYKLNIKLTGTKVEIPKPEEPEKTISVLDTLNSAGIKNNDKYIYGFDVGSDISIIKEKVMNANKKAVVTLKNSSGVTKNKGVVATGDVVTITSGSETKKYEVVVRGDSNGDGEINALDFISIRKYMLKQVTLTGVKFNGADINNDGDINALDFILIRKYMLGDSNVIKQ